MNTKPLLQSTGARMTIIPEILVSLETYTENILWGRRTSYCIFPKWLVAADANKLFAGDTYEDPDGRVQLIFHGFDEYGFAEFESLTNNAEDEPFLQIMGREIKHLDDPNGARKWENFANIGNGPPNIPACYLLPMRHFDGSPNELKPGMTYDIGGGTFLRYHGKTTTGFARFFHVPPA